ncbi:hypothetical protein RB200_12065 [Streptomyces sp. PmtG]
MSTSARWATPIAWAVFLGGAVASIAVGDRLWRLAGEGWPVGGHVFGGLCGFGLLCAWAVAGEARKRRRWAVAVPAAGAGLVATLALVSLIPGRNGRPLGSLGAEGRMWVEDHPDVRWSVFAGLACGALVLWRVLPRWATGRRRSGGSRRARG